ncbi:hypothetical protein pb186bvf_006246 [Paramecium bursaria]
MMIKNVKFCHHLINKKKQSQMSIDYDVQLKIVQTNQDMSLQIDQSVALRELLDIANQQTKYPIIIPIFEITNLKNQIITDINITIGQLGIQKDTNIQIYLYSQTEYQKILDERNKQNQAQFQQSIQMGQFLPPGSNNLQQVEDNRINLVFEIFDGDNRVVQNIKIDQNQTLLDAKEELLVQCGIFNEKRLAVDIDLFQATPKGQVAFNPQKYHIKLVQLQIENNQKIIEQYIFNIIKKYKEVYFVKRQIFINYLCDLSVQIETFLTFSLSLFISNQIILVDFFIFQT